LGCGRSFGYARALGGQVEPMEVAEKQPGTQVLDGSFTVVQQAVGTPKGRDAAARYLREFVESIIRPSAASPARDGSRGGLRQISYSRPLPGGS
jgi:polar amino acid transport system substrate-binding protein